MQESRKTREINAIITWIIRGVAILAEVLFFLPLCVVSCSAQPDEDKVVNGVGATCGFQISYLEDKVVGIWWFAFVFLLAALIIVLWYVKDMAVFREFKPKKMLLCFLTGVLATINVVIMICFINVANLRVESANAEFGFGEVSIRYTLGFMVLLFIQAVFCLGGFGSGIYLIIKEPDNLNRMGSECKKLSATCKEAKEKKRICPGCGRKLAKSAKFCQNCGREYTE